MIQLNVKTEYSILNSIVKVKDVIDKAKRNNMSSLAITDINNLHMAFTFQNLCKKQGIHPILGLCPVIKSEDGYYMLTLLAKDGIGYKNLVALATIANIGEREFPYIHFDDLKQHGKGLFCLTGGISGELVELIHQNKEKEADIYLQNLVNIYGKENVIIEMSNHGLPAERDFMDSQWLENIINNKGFMYVGTNEAYYLQKEHSIHRSIALSMNPNPAGIDIYSSYVDYNNEFYFKTEKEMEQTFKRYLTIYPNILTNTDIIANNCHGEVPVDKTLPEFPLPEGYTSETYLEKLVWEGFDIQFPTEDAFDNRFTRKDYENRLNYEFDTIKKMGFVDYFLIVQDFINWSKDDKVYEHPERYFPNRNLDDVCDMVKNKNFVIKVGPGRGSAAGSLLAYCLKITNLDPMRYDLLFERFLNIERVSMPDVDIDFSNKDREKVVEYVQEKYGYEHVSQIATFQKLKLKSIIKKVAKALGIPYFKADAMTKAIPNSIIVEKENSEGIIEKVEKAPELLSEIEKLEYFSRQINSDDVIKKVFRMGKILEGLPASTGKHAAGVIIGRKPLKEIVALMEVDGVFVTQFEKKDSEAIGLLKMDFLGLQTLDIIEQTENLVKENLHETIDINNIDIHDAGVYNLFQKADTARVFQFEGAGMRNLLTKLHPTKLEHLNAACALYRPGPLEFIPNYLEGKEHPSSVDYPHEAFKEVTEETYGILVYQEQIMTLVQKMAGFSLGEADILRRGISKKEEHYLIEGRKQFIDGAKKKWNVSEDVSNKIYDMIVLFANYGFNKSHSCAYAYVSYQVGWLKHYYPEAFMAANATVASQDKTKVASILFEAQKMGIKVLPPDIKKSRSHFTIEKNEEGTYDIRYGLSAINRVSVKTANDLENIEADTFEEYVSKMPLMKSDLIISLIDSGLFDCFGSRKQLCQAVPSIVAMEKYKRGLMAIGINPILNFLPRKKRFDGYEFSLLDLCKREKDSINVSLNGHILDSYRPLYTEVLSIAETLELSKNGLLMENAPIQLLGVINSIRQINTKKGLPMAFIEFDDETSEMNGVIFPRDFEKLADYINDFQDMPTLLKGKLQVEEDEDENGNQTRKVSFIISTMEILDKSETLYLENSKNITKDIIKEISSFNGICDVVVMDVSNTKSRLLPFKVSITEKLIDVLNKNKIHYKR